MEELMIHQNVKLLAAIREQGWRQVDFARIVGENPSTISRVVNGWLNLDEDRQVKFARALNKTVEELFGK